MYNAIHIYNERVQTYTRSILNYWENDLKRLVLYLFWNPVLKNEGGGRGKVDVSHLRYRHRCSHILNPASLMSVVSFELHNRPPIDIPRALIISKNSVLNRYYLQEVVAASILGLYLLCIQKRQLCSTCIVRLLEAH